MVLAELVALFHWLSSSGVILSRYPAYLLKGEDVLGEGHSRRHNTEAALQPRYLRNIVLWAKL